MRQQQVRRRARPDTAPPPEEQPSPVPATVSGDRSAEVLGAIDAALQDGTG